MNSKVNFSGRLDNTTINEINKKLDFSKTSLKDREKVVNDILDNTSFFDEYFDDYYNYSPSNTDCLSSDNNVCKALERMASYLLNSDEVKAEEDREKIKYVFYTDLNYFKKKIEREKSLDSIINSENQDYQDIVIHFLRREEKNYKKSKSQKITAADLKREDSLGEILRQYNQYLEKITEELTAKGTRKNKNRYILSRIKNSIEDDMVYCKNHFLGVFGYELSPTNETTKYDLDVFDFTNEIHLKGKAFISSKGKPVFAKGLIYLKPEFNPDNEMSYILMDLQNVIDKAGLTSFEQEVLDGIRNGLTQSELAANIGVNQNKVFRTIQGIIKKIIAVGETYDAAKSEK